MRMKAACRAGNPRRALAKKFTPIVAANHCSKAIASAAFSTSPDPN
jgi:hypothetical protein